MINKIIGEIETKVRGAASTSEEKKQELLDLLGRLKTEIASLEKTHREQADSIAGFTQLSAHEATRQHKNPETLEHSVAGLRSSVEEFEQSHPKLAQIVDNLSKTLSGWGI
jgi:prefoldin subunit 5